MLESGTMVTYKEWSLKLEGYCGIVEGIVQGTPNFVWVRWLGETGKKREHIGDLEEV